MKNLWKKSAAAMTAAALCFTLLSACAKKAPDASQAPSASEETVTEGTSVKGDGVTYDFPVLGFTAAVTDTLAKRMDSDVMMVNNAIVEEDGVTLQYGVVSWYLLPEEESENGYTTDSMECIGVLGVYEAGLSDQLTDITGCDDHQEIGKSSDGNYLYYLSTNSQADPDLLKEIADTKVTITEMAAIESGETEAPVPSSSIGPFSTEDISGTAYTQDIFKDYDLTMVNIFTTWCSPCVAEMPELEALYQQMKDQGVGVVGVVLDVLDEKGEIVPDSLSQAQLLAERTGVTYPILLPDSTYMNGRLTGIAAFPETFFVDKDGNIVGETYSGSGDLEYWLSVVEKELASLKGGA